MVPQFLLVRDLDGRGRCIGAKHDIVLDMSLFLMDHSKMILALETLSTPVCIKWAQITSNNCAPSSDMCMLAFEMEMNRRVTQLHFFWIHSVVLTEL